MTRIFLVLMIVLLPLRGWVGDAMAMNMAAQSMNATESVATNTYSTGASGHFGSENAASSHSECPGHAATASSQAAASPDATAVPEDASDSAAGHCNTCGVCQICHTVALANAMAVSALGYIPHALPAMGRTRFASAAMALSQKPPIS